MLSPVRVVTFNIHHGTVGRRGPVDAARLGEVCASFDADIIALQEVDQGTFRAKRQDLAAIAAETCGMAHVFGASRRFPGGHYGNALLVRGTIERSAVYPLPKLPAHRFWQERRTVLKASVTVDGHRLWVACTHLAVPPKVSTIQLDALIERAAFAPSPRIVLGDFNREPEAVEPQFRAIAMPMAGTGPTFPAHRPDQTIDHVAVSADIDILAAEVHRTAMSDHAALVVDVALRT